MDIKSSYFWRGPKGFGFNEGCQHWLMNLLPVVVWRRDLGMMYFSLRIPGGRVRWSWWYRLPEQPATGGPADLD